MNAKEHLKEAEKQQLKHIDNVVNLILKDPVANKWDIKYAKDNLKEYLLEALQKEKNTAMAVVVALEIYLEK